MNIQTINNKHYTELDVIMLNTDKVSNIILNTINNRLLLDNGEILLPIHGIKQHLYFLSNEKPKRYDYVYHTLLDTIFQLSDDCSQEYIDKAENIRKVEATTDSSLGSLKDCPVRGADSSVKYVLPQIPQQFIEHFITEFNKGNVITKVKVEVIKQGFVEIEGGYEWVINYNDNNELIPLVDVLVETPFHKPDFSHLKVQTAVDWLIEQLVNKQNGEITTLSHLSLDQIYNQAKAIQQQHIENAFDDGVRSVLKNFDKAYSGIDGEDYYKSKFKQ
jgi:hypothetical protein